MKKHVSLYSLNQCALFKCHSKRRLADLLFCTQNELSVLAQNARDLYHQFNIPKKNTNEQRSITAPHKNLKKVQSRIFYLLRNIEKPAWVISSTLGKCHITNAEYHQKSKYFFKTDIQHFYNNCSRDRVYHFYKDKLKTSSDVAQLLADLTTRDDIPTGCPTSQLIAYFAYSDMFSNLHTIANQYNCKMSLFVDDIIVSGINMFDYRSLSKEFEIEVRRFNHRLKKSKTKFYSGKKGAPVTGTIIKEHKLLLPNNIRKGIIVDYNLLKDFPDNLELKRSLSGKVQAARRIEPPHFNGIVSFLKL